MTIAEQRRVALKYHRGNWTALYKFYVNPTEPSLRASNRLMTEIDEILEDCSNDRKDCSDLEMLKAFILQVPHESISKSLG